MSLLEVTVSAIVTVLNVALGIYLSAPGPAPLPYSLATLMPAVCGFLASRSGSALLIISEASYLAAAAVLYSRSGLLAPLMLLYTLGVVAGLLKRRGPLEVGLSAPAGYRSAVLSLGSSLVGSGILGLVGVPLRTPAEAFVAGRAQAEVLAAALAVYATQAYLSSLASPASTAGLASLVLASLLSPYTLPLLSVLPALSGPTGVYPRGLRLRLGKVVEVVRGARVGALTVPFERGLNRNIVIVGATGTGKSTLAKNLVEQLGGLGIPVVVLDMHGEYCRWCGDCECVEASELSVDIFGLYGEEPGARAEFVADAISETYSLGNLQRIALTKALSHVYGTASGRAGFDHLLEYLWRASYGEVDLGVPQSVVRSLIPYVEKLRDVFRTGDRRIEECLDSVTVVDFSRLSSGVAAVVAEIAISELYYAFKEMGRELVLVVDEAHRVLKKGGAVARVFREGRKYGISSILITQDVGSVPRELLLNSAVLVSFSLPEVSAARYVARAVSPDDQALYERVLGKLTSLPQFYALASVAGAGSYIIKTPGPRSLSGR